MSYRVVLTRSAIKELDGLPLKTHDQVVQHLRQLEENPRVFGSEKLTAINAYKLRVGNYRIVYEIDELEKEVRVVMVDDRSRFIRGFGRSVGRSALLGVDSSYSVTAGK